MLRLPPGRLLAAACATVLATGLTGGAVSAPTAGGVTAPERTTPGCSDVAVFGVDGHGSGWTTGTASFDPVLAGIVGGMRRQALAAGVSVTSRHLGVAFPTGAALTAPAAGQTRADKAVSRAKVQTWLGDAASITKDVLQEVENQAASCPEQSFVFVGRLQGADVVHRLLLRAVDVPALHDRLVGASLVSDGDRRPNTNATVIGSPAAAATGQGVVGHVGLGVHDVPPGGSNIPVVSLCTTNDLVCDLRGASVNDSVAAVQSYTSPAARTLIRAAGSRMWRQASAWPRTLEAQPLVAAPGAALSRQLTVNVGEQYAGGVVFDTVAGLPAGLTLSPQGLLSGTTTQTGSFTVTYEVHNTAPETSSAAGSVLVVVAAPITGAQVSAGGEDTCTLDTTGTAYCDGQGDFGQLGQGPPGDQMSPVQVGGTGQWADISAGGASTCGIGVDHTLFCWGSNARGQLGLGGGHGRGMPQRVGTDTHWTQVSVDWNHACAVRDNGTLWCWGGNSDGQLGLGGTKLHESPARVGTDSDWVSVAVGGWHTCGIRQDGSAWCWGRNDFGQLGNGSTGRQLRPVRVDSGADWVSLDATWSDTCGLTADSQIECWGLNDHGQLGSGTLTDSSSPVTVADAVDWASVSVGDSHVCGVDGRGNAWCWGSNRYGQLGNGSLQDSSTPVQVAGGRTWATVDVGWLHSCGLGTDGGVACWGSGERGQLGRGDLTDESTP